MYNTIWYQNLTKPFLAPPNWLFGVVWPLLYVMIFVSLIFYIKGKAYNKGSGYLFFILQLLLNFLWSPVFFIMQNITAALVVVILMDLFLILTIRKFYTVSKIAAYLLIPYLIWIIFATYLNAGYLVLNL